MIWTNKFGAAARLFGNESDMSPFVFFGSANPPLELAVDLCDTVEFFYRHDPVPSIFRFKCSDWGVVYVYDSGETAPATPGNSTPPGGTGGKKKGTGVQQKEQREQRPKHHLTKQQRTKQKTTT